VGIVPDDATTKELDDGGALMRSVTRKDVSGSWVGVLLYLAEDMDDSELNTLANKILDLLDKDKEARKRRDGSTRTACAALA